MSLTGKDNEDALEWFIDSELEWDVFFFKYHTDISADEGKWNMKWREIVNEFITGEKRCWI